MPNVPERKVRVLIVDGNVDSASSWSRVLQSGEFEVRVAATAAIALGAYLNFNPDAVILDVEGDDELNLCRRIKLHSKWTTVLAVSGRDREQEAVRAGANVFFRKPVMPTEVLSILRRLS